VSTAPDLSEEMEAFDSGAQIVAGIDEVGRGAWAGPVSVGVVAIDSRAGSAPARVRDSKALTRSVREALVPEIRSWALSSSVGHATARECDLLGMRAAIALASSRALDELGVSADVVIVDGPLDLLEADSLFFGDLVAAHTWRRKAPRVVPVVKGDQRCATVAAASVLAKVARDQMMASWSPSYPGFDFDRNVGYPSQSHQRALRGYGLTSIHRSSWSYLEAIPWLTGQPKATAKPAQ
jgi:ribonuclease HII